MSPIDKLFSFEGRLRRRDWWILSVLLSAFYLLAGDAVLRRALGPEMGLLSGSTAWTESLAAHGVLGLVSLALLWPHIALSVKRAHDRDRSGRPYVIAICATQALGLIPSTAGATLTLLIGPVIWGVSLWILATLGFPDGTPGPNRFGPSPKGLPA